MDELRTFYQNCRLCPRQCGADRTAGERGVCGAGDQIRIARAALHFWEEPCISSPAGSGAVFFSGCALGCIYCQNREISFRGTGKEISPDRLASVFLGLQEEGADNINLVTPDHFAPSVVRALSTVRESGSLHIPVICNCSGYMSPETVRMLAPWIDVWLPDMKYVSGDLAGSFSAAPDYFQTASQAIRLMSQAAPLPVFDERGMIKKGVIVRHLVLPGHTRESIRVLDWLHREFQDRIYISILRQYTPMPGIESAGFPELSRTLTDREYDRVTNAAIDMGITRGFIQEKGVARESFIPAFSSLPDFPGENR